MEECVNDDLAQNREWSTGKGYTHRTMVSVCRSRNDLQALHISNPMFHPNLAMDEVSGSRGIVDTETNPSWRNCWMRFNNARIKEWLSLLARQLLRNPSAVVERV